jgi:hypothetical protein
MEKKEGSKIRIIGLEIIEWKLSSLVLEGKIQKNQ